MCGFAVEVCATTARSSESNATVTCCVLRVLESKLGKLKARYAGAHRRMLGRSRASNLTSDFHSATRQASVTSWQASDARPPSTQSHHASKQLQYHLRPRSDHRETFPALHAHCDPSPPSLEVKELLPANVEEKDQHHNHVRAPSRARACEANERGKWTAQCRFTTT